MTENRVIAGVGSPAMTYSFTGVVHFPLPITYHASLSAAIVTDQPRD